MNSFSLTERGKRVSKQVSGGTGTNLYTPIYFPPRSLVYTNPAFSSKQEVTSYSSSTAGMWVSWKQDGDVVALRLVILRTDPLCVCVCVCVSKRVR